MTRPRVSIEEAYKFMLVGVLGGLNGWFLPRLASYLFDDASVVSAFSSYGLLPCLALLCALSLRVYGRMRSGGALYPAELAVAGALSLILGCLGAALRNALLSWVGTANLGQMLICVVVGLIVGFITGFDLQRLSRQRLGYLSLGGMVGGALGGAAMYIIKASFGEGVILGAFGWSIALAIVALAAALTPVLAMRHRIVYSNSQHRGTQVKYGVGTKSWPLLGQQFIIGSSHKLNQSDIFLPDSATVAPMHALIERHADGYSLRRHPHNPHHDLRLDTRSLDQRPVRLRSGSRILVGSTELHFESTAEGGMTREEDP